jgi:hypothetical protein
MHAANEIQVRKTDLAGNNSDIIALQQVIFDPTKPTLQISDNKAGDALYNEVVTLNFTFSENVYGFDISDISVNQGSATSFAKISDKQYTVSLSNAIGGQQNVALNLSTVFDISGNGFETTTLSHAQNYTLPPPSTIDLGGSNGKLMSLITVNGGNFYAWDRNGDGVLNQNYDFISSADLKALLGLDGTVDDIWVVAGKNLKLPSFGGIIENGVGWHSKDLQQQYAEGSLMKIIDNFDGVSGASDLTSQGQPLIGWDINNSTYEASWDIYWTSTNLNSGGDRSGVIVNVLNGQYAAGEFTSSYPGVIWQVL